MMEVCVNASSSQYSQPCPNNNSNNNNNNEVKTVRPKRDFRIKVIEVQNGPKWFVWPSRNRGSSEEVDENHNKDGSHATQNGYGALRRSVVRQSNRKQEVDAIVQRTASEPASARRLSAKKEKSVTEPINQMSSMFKIISIDKKWESFDATDDEDEDAKTITESGERRWTTSI